MKTYNTSNANCFQANITFNDVDDARKWCRKFGSSAIQFRSRCKVMLTVEFDEDESARLKGLCDVLFQYKICSHLSYDQYLEDQTYYVLVAHEFGRWFEQFGDYDLEIVEEELEDMEYNDDLAEVKRKIKMIRCKNGEQATIDADIAKLNDK